MASDQREKHRRGAATHMSVAGSARTGSERAILCLLLALLPSSFSLGSGALVRAQANPRVLYQVTPYTWKRVIKTWTRHLERSWTVRQGALTSTGKGRKVCDFDEGAKYCRYQAVILAPYRIRTPNYAIEADIQFVGVQVASFDDLGGMVLRGHGTWPAVGPAVLAGRGGFFGTCGDAGPDGASLGMCAQLRDLTIDGPMGPGPPIWSFRDAGKWHHFRVEVQEQHYRLLIDGHEMEDVTDSRPASQLGDRFGFFETSDPAIGGGLVHIRSVRVLALPPAATPTATPTLGPASGSWRTVASMPTARWGLAAVTGSDGRIYAMGGADGQLTFSGLKVVEAYDPATDTWTCSVGDPSAGCSSRTIAPMPTARDWLAAVRGLDGKIYALGGATGSNFALTTVEAYDPATNSWSCSVGDTSPGCTSRDIASLPTGRSYLAAALGSDGRVYAIGGQGCFCGQTVEAYTPATNSWTTVAPTSADHTGGAAATGRDGRIYAVGGCCHQGVQPPGGMTEAYDPTTNTWRTLAPVPRGGPGLAAASGTDGRIYAIGGSEPCCFGPPVLNKVDAYDPMTDRWETTAPMPTARYDLAAVTDPDGRIYAMGGRSSKDVSDNNMEAYSPYVSAVPPPSSLTATPLSRSARV